MKQHLFKILFVLLSFFGVFSAPISAQRIDLKDFRAKFPKDDAVILNQKEHLFIRQNPNGGDLKVWVEHEEETLMLNASNISFSHDAIFYTGFSTINILEAVTKVPDGRNKYRSVPVEKIEDQDVLESGIFYSDYKRKKFIYPAVENGAILRLRYEEHLSEARMLTPFYFNSYAPVQEAEFSVSFPRTVELAYLLYGEDTNNIRFEKKESGDFITYTWRATDVAKFAGENQAPSRSYYSPHIIVRIKAYQKNGEQMSVLRDEADLYRWYHSLVEQIGREDEEDIQALTAEITAGLETEEEKAKAIFNWVQSNIQYVAFEDGMGGFIPRSAKSVCTKRYGDCKDMANLLGQMFNYAGMEAYLTWIGTRSKPYSYYEAPTPIVDNHMITTLILNGDTLFLDATGKYTPFPLPTPMIQGKEALIGVGDGQFEIKKVPVVAKEKNLWIDTSRLEIRERDLVGKASLVAKGFFQLDLDVRRNLTEETDLKNFWNNYLLKGNNKFALTEFSDQSVQSALKGGLSVPYDFELPGYVKRVGSRILINGHLDRRLQTTKIDLEKRKFDWEFKHRYIHQNVNILKIPDGYQADYVPKNAEYKQDKFGFNIRYKQVDNTIVLDKEVYINTLLVTRADFPAWNDMIDQLVDAYREVIVLTEKR